MRVSEIFNIERPKRKRFISIMLMITGLFSLLIATITVYGQYTGTYLITITRDAQEKGIAIASKKDFDDETFELKFDPIHELKETNEGWINIHKQDAIDNDGQLELKGQNFLAYTFYLKNTGDETINIRYVINITDDYKNIAKATFFKVMEFRHNKELDEFMLIRENNFPEEPYDNTKSTIVADMEILSFKAKEIRKFTFFVWFDEAETNPSMLGGAIKFDWVFGIRSDEDEGSGQLGN